ncbi:MAG: Sjogren's syndrome/scleroderma autoantigen 1 family protein [Thermoproteota archaeon]|nr:Sjogren's syndrome/scleroderma autoantigen 1 family protein [Thermoproteota archaeon]
MSEDIRKKAVDMLLNGATLLSEPCPYCKGVRVMKEGNALCVNCGKTPDKKIEEQAKKTDDSPLKQLEEKLQNLTNELSSEKDLEKQQTILKSINLLIDTISKLKS